MYDNCFLEQGMKQLSDLDIEQMVMADSAPIDAAAIKKSLKIKGFAESGTIPRLIDCHNKTEEQAFDEINAAIGHIRDRLESLDCHSGRSQSREWNKELIIITGKSGIIKQHFHTSITDGYLKDQIKSWKLINDGCYKIRIK